MLQLLQQPMDNRNNRGVASSITCLSLGSEFGHTFGIGDPKKPVRHFGFQTTVASSEAQTFDYGSNQESNITLSGWIMSEWY